MDRFRLQLSGRWTGEPGGAPRIRINDCAGSGRADRALPVGIGCSPLEGERRESIAADLKLLTPAIFQQNQKLANPK